MTSSVICNHSFGVTKCTLKPPCKCFINEAPDIKNSMLEEIVPNVAVLHLHVIKILFKHMSINSQLFLTVKTFKAKACFGQLMEMQRSMQQYLSY